jgi:poly(3-hydroxybutyrate) depolymerase
MKNIISLCFASMLAFTIQAQANSYAIGRNNNNITINSDNREFIVHVPTNYTAGTALPMVIYLHGSGSEGSTGYRNSKWKELGNNLNVITVFPTGWIYNSIKDSVKGSCVLETKWNIYNLALCSTETQTPKDDVLFLNNMLDEIINNLSVDTNRVYMVGFSNGGSMTGRCAVELSHRLAGVVIAAGTLPANQVYTPQRNLPIGFMLGNKDALWLRSTGLNQFPMDIDLIRTNSPITQQMVDTYINSFGLTSTPDPQQFFSNNRIVSQTYKSIMGTTNPQFTMVLVKGLGHDYPNGNNHWLKGAELHWGWLSQFTK